MRAGLRKPGRTFRIPARKNAGLVCTIMGMAHTRTTCITGSLLVILAKSGFGIQIGTFLNWNQYFGKMRPEPEISDREGHFGGGEGCEKS